MQPGQGPTPERIFEMIQAYQRSAAMKTALDLRLFTALGRESKSAAELAGQLDAAERGVRILCDFLTIHGLLTKNGGTYRSSEDAALFLDETSPAYFGSVGQFMLGTDVFASFGQLTGAVRRGGTMLDGQGTVEPDHPIWVDFARSMVPLMQPSAEFIAGLVTDGLDAGTPLRVLDIAAGHGIFGVTIARHHETTEVTALDWPAVLEVARENAAAAGVAARHRCLPGSAFEVDFGDGYDLVLLTNFLHHYDRQTCTELLRKVHGSLRDGGRAVTLEFVPEPDRVSPPEQASFALVMLATTAAGDAYTFAELESMAADAGFERSTLHRMELPPQSVVISQR